MMIICAVILLLLLLSNTGTVFAQEDASSNSILDDISTSVPLYAIHINQGYKNDSLFNPDNLLAVFPDNQLNIELRPDFIYKGESFAVTLKPRFVSEITEPTHRDEETKSDVFLNEGRIRYNFDESFYMDISRENIQWGPSMMISLSNPFFLDNGRTNPYQEIDGRDFMKLIKVMGNEWTMTLFNNYDPGHADDPLDDFDNIYAVKFDYIGDYTETSLILSSAHTDKLGGYFKYTANDALLLYGEWEIEQGSDGFYPIVSSNTIGYEMSQIYADSDDAFVSILAGVSYTTRDGGTFYFEQLHNDTGYTDDQIDQFFGLGTSASQVLLSNSPNVTEASQQLFLANYNKLRLIGRDYSFFQYLKPNIGDDLDLTLRYSVNNHDYSSQLVTAIEYDFNDDMRLFMLGIFNNGETDTDYGRYHDYIVYTGVTIYLY